MQFNELDIAKRIRDGYQDSPSPFGSMWLVNLRITGTGLAYRAGLKEHAWRDPNIYLNGQFLERCNGLPVIIGHPENETMDEHDFRKRITGCVVLPYIRGDEVWAICRIYGEQVVNAIIENKVSTSPSVLVGDDTVDVRNGDANFCIEGKPFLLDHIALVPLGVWDKDGKPEGVEVTALSEEQKLANMVQNVIGNALAETHRTFELLNQRLDVIEQGVTNVR